MNNILKLRVLAFVVDLLAFSFIKTILVLLYLRTLLELKLIDSIFRMDLFALKVFLIMTLFPGYFILSYYLGNGKTLGKLIFGLKVYSKKSAYLSLKECLLRSLGYLICYWSALILFILPFLNQEKLGIPDWLSNTRVDRETDLDTSYDENEDFSYQESS